MSETGFETFDDVKKFNRVTEEKEYTMDNMDITHVFGDVIYAKIIDESEDGTVIRNGLHIPVNDKTQQYYRFVKVVLVGPKCDPAMKPGDIVMVTSAALAGTRGIKKSDGKYLLIPESHAMSICKPKE